MDFISEVNSASSVDIIAFVKEVVEKFPALRSNIVERLTSILGEARAGKVGRHNSTKVNDKIAEARNIVTFSLYHSY